MIMANDYIINEDVLFTDTINEVQASGWDLRTVSWIDAHGRYCTTLFTNEKGGTID